MTRWEVIQIMIFVAGPPALATYLVHMIVPLGPIGAPLVYLQALVGWFLILMATGGFRDKDK